MLSFFHHRSPLTPQRKALLILGALSAALAALFMGGFLFFILGSSGYWALPGFGMLGLVIFASSFPWFIPILVLVLAGICVYLLRALGYLQHLSPILTTLLLFVATIIAGLLLSLTPAYNPLLRQTSFGRPLLHSYGIGRFHNVYFGTVKEATSDGYTLESFDGRTFTILVTPHTEFPAQRDFVAGDNVVVIGERHRGTVRAFGIRPIPKPPAKGSGATLQG
jgi:hypothetical protein